MGNIAAMGAWTYAYDGENRLVSSTLSGTTTSYSYDGEGRRVVKATGLAATTFVYDAQGQLAEEVATQLAPVHGTEYLTADHLGSTRMTSDASGNALAMHDYVPFGDEIPSGVDGRGALYGGSDGVNKKFTGQYRDSETANAAAPSGLDYFGARYFSAAQGRFTSPDEFKGGIVDAFTGQDIETNTALPYADITNPQTLNKYAYVVNNPLRYTDPTGHCVEVLSCTLEFGAGGSVLGPLGTIGGAVLGAAVGGTIAYFGYKAYEASHQTQDSNTPPPQQNSGPKSAEDMAKDLSGKVGKNSVPYETPTKSGHIDLVGKPHYDKATGQDIPTPHVQEAPKHIGPGGEVNVSKKGGTTRPATKQDVRTAEKLATKKGWLP